MSPGGTRGQANGSSLAQPIFHDPLTSLMSTGRCYYWVKNRRTRTEATPWGCPVPRVSAPASNLEAPPPARQPAGSAWSAERAAALRSLAPPAPRSSGDCYPAFRPRITPLVGRGAMFAGRLGVAFGQSCFAGAAWCALCAYAKHSHGHGQDCHWPQTPTSAPALASQSLASWSSLAAHPSGGVTSQQVTMDRGVKVERGPTGKRLESAAVAVQWAIHNFLVLVLEAHIHSGDVQRAEERGHTPLLQAPFVRFPPRDRIKEPWQAPAFLGDPCEVSYSSPRGDRDTRAAGLGANPRGKREKRTEPL